MHSYVIIFVKSGTIVISLLLTHNLNRSSHNRVLFSAEHISALQQRLLDTYIVMANLPPRDRPIATSFQGSTEGGIDVWARVFRDQARQKLCYHHISGRDIADWPPVEARDFVRAQAASQVATDA